MQEANVATAAPATPAVGTWSGSIKLHNPPNPQWSYAQGSNVMIDIHVFSGTSTPLAGQTVTLTSNGQKCGTAVTDNNGNATATVSTVGWEAGSHSINADISGNQFAATWFAIVK